MEGKKLFLLAMMPPLVLAERIDEIRKEFAAAYHCKAALKPPVHITLYPPYAAVTSHEEKMKPLLENLTTNHSSFELHLDGFDAFKKNGVIFIDVVKNKSLTELHHDTKLLMTKFLVPQAKSNRDYRPHFTIGYRDIPKDLLTEAINDYLPMAFKASFIVDKIFFWRHDGQRWQIINEFPLKNSF